ncbi:unnamed protein product [Notodromas monacha]|uniref:Uncharacterized protein n=1 Tax=Notodromas monacha TaxID=399045 RepID=A0A7R9GF41_9CRUS|nr:unnamed protein product [Notodromas monacha]CAG0918726.1 unnamed protein product [Notodromas monacha]
MFNNDVMSMTDLFNFLNDNHAVEKPPTSSSSDNQNFSVGVKMTTKIKTMRTKSRLNPYLMDDVDGDRQRKTQSTQAKYPRIPKHTLQFRVVESKAPSNVQPPNVSSPPSQTEPLKDLDFINELLDLCDNELMDSVPEQSGNDIFEKALAHSGIFDSRAEDSVWSSTPAVQLSVPKNTETASDKPRVNQSHTAPQITINGSRGKPRTRGRPRGSGNPDRRGRGRGLQRVTSSDQLLASHHQTKPSYSHGFSPAANNRIQEKTVKAPRSPTGLSDVEVDLSEVEDVGLIEYFDPDVQTSTDEETDMDNYDSDNDNSKKQGRGRPPILYPYDNKLDRPGPYRVTVESTSSEREAECFGPAWHCRVYRLEQNWPTHYSRSLEDRRRRIAALNNPLPVDKRVPEDRLIDLMRLTGEILPDFLDAIRSTQIPERVRFINIIHHSPPKSLVAEWWSLGLMNIVCRISATSFSCGIDGYQLSENHHNTVLESPEMEEQREAEQARKEFNSYFNQLRIYKKPSVHYAQDSQVWLNPVTGELHPVTTMPQDLFLKEWYDDDQHLMSEIRRRRM